jgi:class 3 adenylate cyclase
MGQPHTRYARAPDGGYIAYQTIGQGPPDIIMLGSLMCIDFMWDDAISARALRRLASLGRLICFDWRGHGSSDPMALASRPTVDALADEARIVMDAVGSERAVHVGVWIGGSPQAMFQAAAYPDRTESLILVGGMAHGLRGDNYPMGLPADQLAALLERYELHWGTGALAGDATPSRASDPAFAAWRARYERLTMGPQSISVLLDYALRIDVRETLPHIHVPTLVLHPEASAPWTLGFGRYLAEHIPGARLETVPGGDTTLYGADSSHYLDHIERFLAGGPRAAPDDDRVLATVLFTDIVDSTQRARQMGDSRWVALLAEHDALVVEEIERHRGRRIKTTGDGVLAIFDGPTRAVHCAQAISNRMRPLGLEVRAGLHTGEVQLRDDDIGGIAVHIAARISATAGPGEVLVSRTVTDLVVGSNISFVDRDTTPLRGVDGTWQLYAVSG